MIVINWWKAYNFLSIDQAEIHIGDISGLALVDGKNLDVSVESSNG